ncbi:MULTISPECIES: DUF6893 family small protein [Nocardia]|uniref:Uncharacterized protein n=1 Tax=Nocardia cerradoensis TaxID=85688 RepID=A0A231GZY4_9NOCA|nr:hypothetical protein B7C42_05773 [Nocardia cerradoensis]
METVGMVATGVVAAAVVVAALIGIRSIPDMRRYLRMRRM